MKTTANSRDQISPARDKAVGARCNVLLQEAWRNFAPRTGTARDEAPELRFAEVSKSNSGCYIGRNITFTPIYVTLKKISTYSHLENGLVI